MALEYLDWLWHSQAKGGRDVDEAYPHPPPQIRSLMALMASLAKIVISKFLLPTRRYYIGES